MKTESELRNLIQEAYVDKYKGEKDQYKVDPIIYDCFGGEAAVVTYNIPGIKDSEICIIDNENSVRIFDSTAELLRFLEVRQNERMSDKFFRRKYFTPIVFLALIISVVIVGILNPGSQALPVLGSAVGLAAAFFFGEGTKVK